MHPAMKAERTDILSSQQAPIELYSEDSCSWMITDSPTDESPFPMARYVFDDYLEGGALRSGSTPNLFSRHYIGLVAQYSGVGFIDGVLHNVIYPFFPNYLNLPGSQTTTAFVLVQIPWSFKVFFGIISDCVPIWGYRRRPYILASWVFALVMLLILSLIPEGKPYFTNPEYRDVKPEDYTAEIIATINYDSVNDASIYIVPMMACAFGYLLSNVCADGFVVELAQREPLELRGNTQTVIYTTRTVFNMLAYILLGFCFNGEEYGGDFDFSLSFPMLMLIVTIILAPIVPVTWFFLHEEKNGFGAMSFSHYMHTLWDVVKTRAVYQYIAYQFFSGIFASFTYLSKNPIMRNWANVSPLAEKIGGLLSTGMYATSIWFAGNYGRSWDWRRTAIVTMVSYVSLDAFCKLLTIWDIIRSPFFWLGIPILEQIPLGIIFIVSSFIIVELATEGHEGAVYALLTTVYNLAIPFVTAITRNVDSMFDLSTERIQNDTIDVRAEMTMTVLIMWTANLCSLLFLVILPRQKEQTRAIKHLGGSSYFMGVVSGVCSSVDIFHKPLVSFRPRHVLSSLVATAVVTKQKVRNK